MTTKYAVSFEGRNACHFIYYSVTTYARVRKAISLGCI